MDGIASDGRPFALTKDESPLAPIGGRTVLYSSLSLPVQDAGRDKDPGKASFLSAHPRSPVTAPPGAAPPATAHAGKTPRPARRPVAVALKYELGTQTLPRIVASGKGTVAEQILEVAFANGVKVREDADLVEILSAIEVDSDIPVEAIAAVAEILAHVYRANGTLPPEPQPDAAEPAQGEPVEDTP